MEPILLSDSHRRWDCLSLGEVMLRLDPGEGRVHTTRQFAVWEGGGEYNVARGLRRCFGLRTAVATVNSLQPFAPAFFVFPNSTSVAAEQAGTGTLVANSSLVAGASPAKAGDIVSLFATGFGDTNPLVASGQLATGIATLVNHDSFQKVLHHHRK